MHRSAKASDFIASALQRAICLPHSHVDVEPTVIENELDGFNRGIVCSSGCEAKQLAGKRDGLAIVVDGRTNMRFLGPILETRCNGVDWDGLLSLSHGDVVEWGREAGMKRGAGFL